MTAPIDLALQIAPSAVSDFSEVLSAERLIRLHPHWHIEKLQQAGDEMTARLKDHATDTLFDLIVTLNFTAPHEFTISCKGGPAQSILFFAQNSRLHVSFTPHGDGLTSEEEQDLTLWIQSIRQYLRLYAKTTPYTRFFRGLMNRAILKMNPSQRKICLMLYRFTLLEIVVILLIVIGYFAFR